MKKIKQEIEKIIDNFPNDNHSSIEAIIEELREVESGLKEAETFNELYRVTSTVIAISEFVHKTFGLEEIDFSNLIALVREFVSKKSDKLEKELVKYINSDFKELIKP